MLMPEKCPICRDHVRQEQVIETLQGGGNTATVKVLAGLCQLKNASEFLDSKTFKRLTTETLERRA